MSTFVSCVILGLIWSLGAAAQSANMKSPNVSADALFLYRRSNFNSADTSTVRNGLDLQEAELVFYTDVDPYSRVTINLSVHPEYSLESDKIKETWQVEPEELYAESEYFPSLTLKLGKFKAEFGKHNLMHTHVYPFVDAPMINSKLLGEEGLNDAGVSAAYLLPFNWYSEVTGQYLSGGGENDEFNSQTPNDGVGVGHWKNLFDLNDALTMETGLSYAGGPNDMGGETSLSGADLTFKWRPTVGGLYRSAIFASEYIRRDRTAAALPHEASWGLSNWIAYQWAERWSGRLRYETLQVSNSISPDDLADGHTDRGAVAVDFHATEFSYFRLEYDLSHGPQESSHPYLTDERRVYLQANFVIGSHPAHSY
jgi:hypothetical protein